MHAHTRHGARTTVDGMRTAKRHQVILLATFSSWCCQWFSANGNTTKPMKSTKDALRCRYALCGPTGAPQWWQCGNKRTRACAQRNVSLIRSQIFSVNKFLFCVCRRRSLRLGIVAVLYTVHARVAPSRTSWSVKSLLCNFLFCFSSGEFSHRRFVVSIKIDFYSSQRDRTLNSCSTPVAKSLSTKSCVASEPAPSNIVEQHPSQVKTSSVS